MTESNAPTVTQWARFKDDGGAETRLKVVDYANCTVVFVLQGPQDRVASWIEARRSVDALSGNVDVNINVLFGDRDDIWSRVIARRAADVAKKDIMLAISLAKESKCEEGAQHVCQILGEYLKSTFAV